MFLQVTNYDDELSYIAVESVQRISDEGSYTVLYLKEGSSFKAKESIEYFSILLHNSIIDSLNKELDFG